jgi:DNA mismatch repair protein MSH5
MTMTERSLVLIDEYGKGTSAVDGISLYAGLLQYFCSVKCPRIYTITHFHVIFGKETGILPLDCLEKIQVYEMEMFEEDEALVFLFKLRKGYCKSSWALNCAKIAGISPLIIEKANRFTEKYKEGKPFLETVDVLPLQFIEKGQKIIELLTEWDEKEESFQALMNCLSAII